MAKVFLSYAHEDRDTTQGLAAAIADYGHEIWWDKELVGGEDFRQRIEETLSGADAVVVVWTEVSVAPHKYYIAEEVRVSLKEEKLIAVRFDRSVRPPEEFAHLHAHDLSEWDRRTPRTREVETLVGQIDRIKHARDQKRITGFLNVRPDQRRLIELVFDTAMPGGLRLYRLVMGSIGTSFALWALAVFGATLAGMTWLPNLATLLVLTCALALARALDQFVLIGKGRRCDRFFDKAFSFSCLVCLLIGALGGFAISLSDFNPGLVLVASTIGGVVLLVLLYAARALVTGARILQARV